MSDILERLNKHAKDFDLTESEADEPGNIVHDLCEAHWEIERLRAALRKIAYQYENQDLNHVDFRVFAKRTADAALSPHSDGGAA